MKARTEGFRICGGKGFHITFRNQWTVSVQFGPGSYCENYDLQIGRDERTAGENGSANAEVAAWPKSGNMIDLGEGDTVAGHQTPAQVLALLRWVEAQPESVDGDIVYEETP